MLKESNDGVAFDPHAVCAPVAEELGLTSVADVSASADRIRERAVAWYDDAGWRRQADQVRLIRAQVALGGRRRVVIDVSPPDPADADLSSLFHRVVADRALLERRYSDALASVAEAERAAAVAGSQRVQTAILDLKARALVQIGRGAESIEIYDWLFEATLPPREAAQRALNRAWVLQMMVDSGARRVASVAPEVEALLAEAAQVDPQPSNRLLADIAFGRALLAVQKGDWRSADWLLANAEAQAEAGVDIQRWVVHTRAQWALETGDVNRARALWTSLTAEAADGDVEFAWRASLGLWEVESLAGVDARSLTTQLETAFQALAAQVTLADRADAFALWMRRPIAGQVARDIQAGDICAAHDAARRYRNLALARYWLPATKLGSDAAILHARRTALAAGLKGAPSSQLPALKAEIAVLDDEIYLLVEQVARTAGARTANALRKPTKQEAILVFAPWTVDDAFGWLPIVATSEGCHTGLPLQGVNEPTTHDVQKALKPLRTAVGAARDLTFVLPSALDGLDATLLDFGDGPLYLKHDLAWSMDLGVEVESGVPQGDVLLVGDPTGDPNLRLSFAAHIRGVRQIWAERTVHTLAPADTMPVTFADRLSESSLAVFHFAGHGVFGQDPLYAGLLLRTPSANGPGASDRASDRLTARDVLMAGHVPPVVTLAACEGARTGAGVAGGLGLAPAFVLAGAHVAVGSARPVNSDVAFEFYALLHEALAQGASPRMAFSGALRSVAAHTSRTDDWGGLRLLLSGG